MSDVNVKETRHTPGPWMVLPNNERGQFVILTEHGPRLDIAETYGWPDTPREANARLIAAAPDLLAALYDCEEYFDNRADVIDGDYGVPEPNKEMRLLTEVRAAIAKAEAR